MGAGGWNGLARMPREPLYALLAGLVLLYMPHETTAAWQPSGLASLTIGSTYFWATLALWTSCLTARPS